MDAFDDFFNAVLKLKDVGECRKFFEDVCTIKEVLDMAQRLEVASLLKAGKNYQEVSKLTGAIPKFIQGYVLKFLGFDQNIKHAANQTVINAQVAPRFLKYRWHQFILGPAIGSVLYLIVILFLKDDQTHIAEVERQLKEKREAAAVEKAEA